MNQDGRLIDNFITESTSLLDDLVKLTGGNPWEKGRYCESCCHKEYL